MYIYIYRYNSWMYYLQYVLFYIPSSNQIWQLNRTFVEVHSLEKPSNRTGVIFGQATFDSGKLVFIINYRNTNYNLTIIIHYQLWLFIPSNYVILTPDAPCMEYLHPYLPTKLGHAWGSFVGRDSSTMVRIWERWWTPMSRKYPSMPISFSGRSLINPHLSNYRNICMIMYVYIYI